MLPLRFRRLEPADYQALIERCQIIEADAFGEKVLLTPEGLMVKIFRRKRLLTTATFIPYALRFTRNARRLAESGISTITVVDQAYCPPLKRHLITYQPLPGVTLRSALNANPEKAERLLGSAAGFIATLHQKGVYFRSLHFGNIIVSPDGKGFGLIDVADMTIHSGPLADRLRTRNFRHLLRRHEDALTLAGFGLSRFVEQYLAASGMGRHAAARFFDALCRTLPALTPSMD